MKKTLLFLTLLCCISVQAQNPKTGYDKVMADSLGGDDYGMKMYTLVILKTGPNDVKDKKVLDSLFAGHMANINRLVEAKKMVVAGPIGKNEKSYRGIFILNVKTIEEANELLKADPTISSKLFEVDVIPWYGSAALPEYLKSHAKIEKQKH